MTRVMSAIAVLACGLVNSSLVHGERLQAVVGAAGQIRLARGNEKVCELGAGLYDLKWNSVDATADARKSDTAGKRALRINVPDGGTIAGWATIRGDDDTLIADYAFTPEQDVALNSLHVSAEFDIQTLAGGRWSADGRSGKFPKEFGEVQIFQGSIRRLTLELPAGGDLEFRFVEPTSVLVQDNRRWGPSFSVRISRSSTPQSPFPQGVPVTLGFTLAAAEGLSVEQDAPVTIVAGDEWIPLRLELEILPGSALDFSTMGLQDAPAGKHGWLKAREDGTFFFERQPDRPARFYGVNFCFSAHYITHEQSDQLADRLARLGYNAVRLHHYEGELTASQGDRTQLNPEKLDQLDHLVAACIERGIYVTTDLFVSRPVDVARFLPEGASRNDAMNKFKVLAALNPAAFENWKAFARNLLNHVNPYTQRAYKDEPGLAWLALINEGNLGNFVSLAKEIPDYRQAWNRWLGQRYGNRAGLAAAWDKALKDDEDPEQATVALEGSIHGQDLRGRDLVLFLAQVEKDFLARATEFLREELGAKALVTNMNGWTNHATSQMVRDQMDYVDDHFYVDHPRFLEQSWRLPSRCPNTSPIAGGASGGRHLAFTRLFDKPFTVSEYNYSAPGRYRGVGGILTGSLGAVQGWDAIWRFAYSHSRENLFRPGKLDYFNMVADPLGQAAERASICLFLRGDMQTAPHSVSIAMTDADFSHPPAEIPSLAPGWHWAAWITRVGTVVANNPASLNHDLVLPLGWAAAAGDPEQKNPSGPVDAYRATDEQLVALLRERGILLADNPTDPAKRVFRSETGEITIDAPHDRMTLDTPRTAGGFAPAGESIATLNGVKVSVQDADATVWISSLDDLPITKSSRLLVTHLTDLQNTEIRYAERARQTLLDWGTLPHLVRAGKAEVHVSLAEPEAYGVWALSTSGKRLAEVAANREAGGLTFTADVAGFGDHGAVFCYELSRR